MKQSAEKSISPTVVENVVLLLLVMFVVCLGSTSVGFAYEGPRPLAGIEVAASVSESSGIFTFNYSVSNPSGNDGSIESINVFIDTDPTTDQTLTENGLPKCKNHAAATSSRILSEGRATPVGSLAPADWSCSYAVLAGESRPSFSWGAALLAPGKKINGYILKSRGLPAIRNVYADPEIDIDRLPEEYNEDAERMFALIQKVRWKGKTIGPKPPPKVFSASSFASNIDLLNQQCAEMKWYKTSGLEKSFQVKLDAARKKLEEGNLKAAKETLKAFMNELTAQNGKAIAPEAYALLFFNIKYLVDHI